MKQITNNLTLVLKYSLETILSGKISIEVTRLFEFTLRNLSNIKFDELEIKWENWQIEELTQLTLKIVTYSLRMGRAVNAWRVATQHDKIDWVKASIELDQEIEGRDHI